MPMKMSTRRFALWVALAVFAAIVTVAAVAGLVNSYNYDQDSQKRDSDRTAQLIAGCENGNKLRVDIGGIASSVKALDLYIANQLRAGIRNPAPGVTPAVLATAERQANHLEDLAAAVNAPKQQDCQALYSNPPNK